MNEGISIQYKWTADDLLNAYKWHFRHRVRPVFRWALWMLAVLFIVVGTIHLWTTRSPFPGAFLLCVGIYIPVNFLLIRPWHVRRQFAKRPDRDTEIEWRIASDSIHVRGAHGSSDFVWPALVKVVQTPAGFLFYPTEQIFHWLPRRGFSSQADFEWVCQVAQQNAAVFTTTSSTMADKE